MFSVIYRRHLFCFWVNYVIYIVLCRIYFKGALRRGYLAVSLRRISMYQDTYSMNESRTKSVGKAV